MVRATKKFRKSFACRDRAASARATCESAPSVQFSFFAVPPRSLHHRLRGRLRSPRSTQVLSTRSLGLLNFASEVGLDPAASTQCDLWCSLPYTTGRDCDRQSGGGWGEGWGWGMVNRHHISAVIVPARPHDTSAELVTSLTSRAQFLIANRVLLHFLILQNCPITVYTLSHSYSTTQHGCLSARAGHRAIVKVRVDFSTVAACASLPTLSRSDRALLTPPRSI